MTASSSRRLRGAQATSSAVGPGVPAGEEGHVVTLPHELFGQVGDDPLGPAVSGGRDALHQRCDLCDSHREHPSFSWCPGTNG